MRGRFDAQADAAIFKLHHGDDDILVNPYLFTSFAGEDKHGSYLQERSTERERKGNIPGWLKQWFVCVRHRHAADQVAGTKSGWGLNEQGTENINQRRGTGGAVGTAKRPTTEQQVEISQAAQTETCSRQTARSGSTVRVVIVAEQAAPAAVAGEREMMGV